MVNIVDTVENVNIVEIIYAVDSIEIIDAVVIVIVWENKKNTENQYTIDALG